MKSSSNKQKIKKITAKNINIERFNYLKICEIKKCGSLYIRNENSAYNSPIIDTQKNEDSHRKICDKNPF